MPSVADRRLFDAPFINGLSNGANIGRLHSRGWEYHRIGLYGNVVVPFEKEHRLNPEVHAWRLSTLKGNHA